MKQILKLNFYRKELRKEHHILHFLFCFFLYESQKFTNQRFWTRNFRFLIPTKLETIPPSRPSRLDWLAPVHVFFLLEKGTQYGNGRSRQNLYSLRPFCKATWCWIGNWLILNMSKKEGFLTASFRNIPSLRNFSRVSTWIIENETLPRICKHFEISRNFFPTMKGQNNFW